MHRTYISTYLSHICDHVECDVGESLVEVAANHTDPRERVPGVGPCLIESHHVGQMGQLCVLLYQTHLGGGRDRKMHQTALTIHFFFLSCIAFFYNH